MSVVKATWHGSRQLHTALLMKAHPNLSPATNPDPCAGPGRFGDIEPEMAEHLRLCQKVTGFQKWESPVKARCHEQAAPSIGAGGSLCQTHTHGSSAYVQTAGAQAQPEKAEHRQAETS